MALSPRDTTKRRAQRVRNRLRTVANEDIKVRSLLSEVVAIRKAGRK